MAKNYQNIRSYADLTSGVFVAPKGTTLPVDIVTALNASFIEAGWLSEDGVSETQTADQAEFTAWQGSTVVKRKRTKVGKTITFQALEENLVTYGLKFRGKTPVVTGVAGSKVAKVDFANQAVTDERAWVIELHDGLVKKRIVIPAGDYQITGSTPAAAGSMATVDIEITVIGEGAYELTNHPAVTGDTTVTTY